MDAWGAACPLLPALHEWPRTAGVKLELRGFIATTRSVRPCMRQLRPPACNQPGLPPTMGGKGKLIELYTI